MNLSYEIRRGPVGSNVFYFNTPKGLKYELAFTRKEKEPLQISVAFGVINSKYEGEEYPIVNQGEIYNVMKMIVNGIKLYIEEHPCIRSIEFSGEFKQGKKGLVSQRTRLFLRYIEKHKGNN